LLLLVVISVLPALGIVVYSGIARLERDAEHAKENAWGVVQSLAYSHEIAMERTRQFLMTLSSLPDVQNRNVPACNRLFRVMLKENPLYSTIFLADAEGMVIASAQPFTPFSIRDRIFFPLVSRTKRFAVGEYLIGAISKRPVLPCAHPVLDPEGQIRGVVVAGIALEHFGQVFEAAHLPEGSMFAVSDLRNIRLYSSSESDRSIEESDSPEIFKKMSAQPEGGVITEVGKDGVKRLRAYKGLYRERGVSPYLFMSVGIPEEQALAQTQKTMRINVALFFLALAIVLALAWFLGNLLIVRRLTRLKDTSRRLGHGDLSVRTGLAPGQDEIGELIGVFDEMAGQLEKKESERSRMEKELEALSTKDQLTGLYNRRGFIALAEQQLKIAERTKTGPLFLFADLDNLKWINDHLGHVTGDEFLVETADVFKSVFRGADIVARMGGDEFAVLAFGSPEESPNAIRNRLQRQIDLHNVRENRNYELSISVGIVHCDPRQPASLDEWMARADALMYEEKKRKKNGGKAGAPPG
jgi:diguanylate cyclase (GGDEF)-like protein